MARTRKRTEARYAGVDVSKDKVDAAVAERTGDCVARFSEVERSVDELNKLAAKLKKQGASKVVLEASGGFERLVCKVMHGAGLEVFLVNPAASHAFRKATSKHAKTDEIDALLLAHFGHACQLTPWEPPPLERETLKELVRVRESLVEQRVALSHEHEQQSLPAVREIVASLITTLKQKIAELDKQIANHIKGHSNLLELSTRMQTVPGVGPVVSATLLAELPELETLDKKKLTSLAGLAPFANSSGKKVGPAAIRGGRKRVRRVLYQAATVAKRHNPPIKAFAARLAKHGKKPKQVNVACARKLLHILSAMVQDKRDWALQFTSATHLDAAPSAAMGAANG